MDNDGMRLLNKSRKGQFNTADGMFAMKLLLFLLSLSLSLSLLRLQSGVIFDVDSSTSPSVIDKNFHLSTVSTSVEKKEFLI